MKYHVYTKTIYNSSTNDDINIICSDLSNNDIKTLAPDAFRGLKTLTSL
jgi:hypothetical protein